ncbi:hypothetical protein GCM10022631_10520 [Deinococcus rubellus]|uniref:hypothetical protein n=1 Tax=Deinococcus rubellus TaxID=1889240 RepID=UPI0031E8C2C0
MNRKQRREHRVVTSTSVLANTHSAPAKFLTIYPNLDPRIELALNTLDGPGWRTVIVRSNKLLTQAVKNVQVRQGNDMVMANLFDQVFDLHAFALSTVAVDGFRAPMLIQEQTDRLSKHLWEGVYKTIRLGILAGHGRHRPRAGAVEPAGQASESSTALRPISFYGGS